MPRLTRASMEEKQRKILEERFAKIDDNDISIISAWDHLQNVESSEKLLEKLLKHHGLDGVTDADL